MTHSRPPSKPSWQNPPFAFSFGSSTHPIPKNRYPPDPINIDKAFFNHLQDLHKVDLIASSVPYQNPDEIPAVISCPQQYTQVGSTSECLSPNGQLAPLDSVSITCENSTYTLNPQTNKSIYPTCIPDVLLDPSQSRSGCPEGYSLEPQSTVCVSDNANTLPSRPLDLVLWDFEGTVTFGRIWPAQAGVVMTVLVYGDREIASAGNLKEGEVLETYLNKTLNERGIYYPDPHLSTSTPLY